MNKKTLENVSTQIVYEWGLFHSFYTLTWSYDDFYQVYQGKKTIPGDAFWFHEEKNQASYAK